MFDQINWQIDGLSLIIGAVAGIFLTVIWYLIDSPLRLGWKRLTSWLSRKIAWLRTGVEARFREEMGLYVNKRHLLDPRADINQIFIPPRFLGPIAGLDLEQRTHNHNWQLFYLWPEIAEHVGITPPPTVTLCQLLQRGRRVVIADEHGKGKTTLLSFLTKISSEKGSVGAYSFLSSRLPIYVHLVELQLLKASHRSSLNKSHPIHPLALALQERKSGITYDNVFHLLKRYAEQGLLFLLLDGCDEIAQEQKEWTVKWLQSLLATYPDIWIIVASSNRGYGPLVELGFSVTSIMPWRIGQAEQLSTLLGDAVGSEKNVPVESFWNPGQTAIVTGHRLMLSLERDIYESNGEPIRNVEHFEEACRNYLALIENKYQETWLAPAAREYWQVLALQMLMEETSVLDDERITATAESVLREYDALDLPQALSILKETLINSPLFVQYPRQCFGFLSPNWRDFLAASQLAQNGSKDILFENLHNSSWENVVRFYVGRTESSDLANKLLQQNGSPYETGLFRLAQWLTESLDRGEWSRQVLVRLGRLIIDHKLPVTWRQRATLALASTGEEGVTLLLKQLMQETDPNIRQIALASLAHTEGPASITMLNRLLDDGEQGVRIAAVHALAWMVNPMAEEKLFDALHEQDDPVCSTAAMALALNSTYESQNILREAIKDAAVGVRKAAVAGLSILDDAWAQDLLKIVAHEDEQRAIRAAAGCALQESNGLDTSNHWKPLEPGEQPWLINWAIEHGQVVPPGNAVLPVLLQALNSGEAEIRYLAATVLGDLATRSAEEALTSALDDVDPDVRNAAFESLCRIDRNWTVDSNSVSAV